MKPVVIEDRGGGGYTIVTTKRRLVTEARRRGFRWVSMHTPSGTIKHLLQAKMITQDDARAKEVK